METVAHFRPETAVGELSKTGAYVCGWCGRVVNTENEWLFLVCANAGKPEPTATWYVCVECATGPEKGDEDPAGPVQWSQDNLSEICQYLQEMQEAT